MHGLGTILATMNQGEKPLKLILCIVCVVWSSTPTHDIHMLVWHCTPITSWFDTHILIWYWTVYMQHSHADLVLHSHTILTSGLGSVRMTFIKSRTHDDIYIYWYCTHDTRMLAWGWHLRAVSAHIVFTCWLVLYTWPSHAGWHDTHMLWACLTSHNVHMCDPCLCPPTHTPTHPHTWNHNC